MNTLYSVARYFEKRLNKLGWEDQIPGGLADENKPGDFDEKAIEEGTEVEMEHTDDPDKATEIAMDHLEENEDYYTFLKHMEHLMDET